MVTRRSQAERTAETRSRIVMAVVESIAQVGLRRTTASEIARRAGVTWGAVQHQFGGKDGMLEAVLEHSFHHFSGGLGDLSADGAPLAERVHLFVERAWAHFRSPLYQSTFEILLHSEQDDEAEESAWQARMLEAWDDVFRRIFSDVPLPRRRRFILHHYTVSVLSGLASTLRLEGEGARLAPGELDFLEQTVEAELRSG
jgi:AcrR family transcriptional regulator